MRPLRRPRRLQRLDGLNVFLTEADYRQDYMVVRDAWAPDPPPASTLVVVKALALPAFKVEIEAVAAA